MFYENTNVFLQIERFFVELANLVFACVPQCAKEFAKNAIAASFFLQQHKVVNQMVMKICRRRKGIGMEVALEVVEEVAKAVAEQMVNEAVKQNL